MKKKHLSLGIIGFVILIIVVSLYYVRKADYYVFPGLSGPDEVSTIIPEPPTPIDRYESGGVSRLAIYLTNPDSPWLGLAHGLKTIGVPFIVTTDYQRAVKHKVVLVYPEISGKRLTVPALRALAAHANTGGTLIAVNVLGGGLEGVFGFEEAVPARSRFSIRFSGNQPENDFLSDEREKIISLGDPQKRREAIGTYGYTKTVSPPIAEYEDGTAAITKHAIGKGKAFALGLDLGGFLLRGYNNREEWIARSYVNEFEPTLDVFLRWLRRVYLEDETNAVTLGTVPDNRALTLILTHDVDSGISLINSIPYARYEKSQDLRATYFVQTKYVRDWNDKIFINEKNAHYLTELGALGMELASHSVSHSKIFSQFPAGSGDEKYPDYHPFVKNRNSISRGSILGELRISKFLLEKLGRQTVVGFRPGHLALPNSLPQSLAATGYKYSSSVTANNSLTHLPFQLNFNRDILAESPVFEFPITIEDEQLLLKEGALTQAVDLARKIARYGGLYVVLIHTDVVDAKLEFEKNLVEAVKDMSWIGSIGDFGKWWEARNSVSMDVVTSSRGKTVELKAPLEIEGLTIQVPLNWKYMGGSPAEGEVSVSPGIVLLKKAVGNINLFFNSVEKPETKNPRSKDAPSR